MNLNEIMEFGRVIQVHDDGSVTVRDDLHAPELYDGKVSDGWSLLGGYSGQYNYSGPIMHPSEYIGGRMARDILSEPGIYVALVAYYPTDSEDADDIEGWAVAKKVK